MTERPEKLIECVKAGDESCQKQLYMDYRNYAMSIALRLCRDRIEAQEVMQDAFVNVFRRIDQYDVSKPFRPWFRQIVVNATIDYHRKYHKQEKHLDAESTYESERDGGQDVLGSLTNEDIMKAVQALPDSYRIAFVLHVVEGYKHEEIAEQLGITVGTTKSNLFKAKKKLQELLKHLKDA